ncbi:MAG: phosphoribosylformylglycinamidine cyclo-ligase, partial [Proteobacteria bacterium]|nr:phosphoribosylformylglycinamidine cyclo-ligase [Pseudomonadota bacterium]
MESFPMPAKRPVTYADAGVSIEEAGRATSKIKGLAERTFDRRVLTGIGAFGAAYDIGKLGLKGPVLISSADGVGTKLMVAFAMNVHHTVGQDLVNHCVNDIAVQGARPLFFLDYFATGKLHAAVAAKVVKGLSIACRENDCAL